MSRSQRLFLVLLCCSVFAACATQRGRELGEINSWETRKDVLQHTTRWEFSGRIGVRAGEDGFNGKIWWWHRDDVFRATLSGPLGVGSVRIDGQDRKLSVTDSDGQVTQLEDAEVDLRVRYGWTIPVESLRYWTLGVPDPRAMAEVDVNERGLLASLKQGGWSVVIDQYRDGGGQMMPRRITATNGDARVRLIIDQWVFF